MASTPESHRTTIHNSDSKNLSGASASYFQKTVCLHDWWLIRAENDFNGKTLAVAGLTSRPEQAVRVFTSAPIAKRYDVFTLETADGICVVLRGFINKLRTADNGFMSEVFKYFLFGFPPNWETYAANCFRREAFDSVAAAENAAENTSVTDNLLCKSENADMNNCTPTNMNSPLYETSPMNKQDSNVEESRSPPGSDAKQELNHGDTTTLDVMQNTSATETAVPFTDLAGSPNKTGADVQDEVENKRKRERETWKKAKRKIIFDSPGSGIRMNTRQEKCMASPECVSYGRSRSGRLLLPTMEFWRNQIPVYDSDRMVRGIQEGLPLPDVRPQPKPRGRGSKSEGGRKR